MERQSTTSLATRERPGANTTNHIDTGEEVLAVTKTGVRLVQEGFPSSPAHNRMPICCGPVDHSPFKDYMAAFFLAGERLMVRVIRWFGKPAHVREQTRSLNWSRSGCAGIKMARRLSQAKALHNQVAILVKRCGQRGWMQQGPFWHPATTNPCSSVAAAAFSWS